MDAAIFQLRFLIARKVTPITVNRGRRLADKVKAATCGVTPEAADIPKKA